MCHNFMSYIELLKDKKSFLSDKQYAISLWFLMGIIFIFTYINFLKVYIRIPLFLFLSMIILGFLRKGFITYFYENKDSKLVSYLLCMSIYFFIIIIVIFVYNLIKWDCNKFCVNT